MKKILILAGAAGLALHATATCLSPEQALERLHDSNKVRALAGKNMHRPTLFSTVGNLYLFSSEAGYMILPADDQAPALLGYSDDGQPLSEINPELAYWLEYYNKELSSLPVNGSRNIRKAATERPQRKAIAPLTQTKWNQEAPYNDKCPVLNGERSVTGCVATAMAQVMKYHNYPDKGKGEHSYEWKTGGDSLSFNYGETTFDWSNMTNIYDSSSTKEQKDAVATLMLACGISVNMNYSPTESGASTIVMGTSLIDYFNYDKGLWMPSRDYYGLYEWEDMIYADLAEGLPVLYAGQGTAGGHQFICDGYSEDGYFHFNWGWGGMSNGYFLLTALNPANLGVGGGAGGFNSDQQIALGVRPPVEGSTPVYLMYCGSNFLPLAEYAEAGEDMECSGSFYNNSMHELPSGCAIGMRVVAADGSYDKYLESHSAQGLPSGYGFNSMAIVFPQLEDGSYTITPAFYDGSKWEEMPVKLGDTGCVIATVSDGIATLSSPAPDTVTISSITVPESIYQTKEFPMSFTVTNDGDREYIGNVIPVLVDSSGNPVAESVYRPIDILGSESEHISDYIGNFKAVEGAVYEPGSYTLLFVDESGNQLSEPQSVTILEAPAQTTISVTGLKLDMENPVTEKDAVKFSFEVECTEGYFSNVLDLVVFPYVSGQPVSSVASESSKALFLSAGESQTVEVTIDLSDLTTGKYFAAVYSGQSQMSSTVVFELSESTGITSIQYDSIKPETIYDLYGVRHDGKLHPGIYILNGIKILIER